MNYFSKPKPAAGTTFDGTLGGVNSIIEWVTSEGFEVNAAGANFTAGKWTVDLTYFRPAAQGMVPVYKTAKITQGIHIVIEGEDEIYSYANETDALVDFDQA